MFLESRLTSQIVVQFKFSYETPCIAIPRFFDPLGLGIVILALRYYQLEIIVDDLPQQNPSSYIFVRGWLSIFAHPSGPLSVLLHPIGHVLSESTRSYSLVLRASLHFRHSYYCISSYSRRLTLSSLFGCYSHWVPRYTTIVPRQSFRSSRFRSSM